jgi:hypothetical protein
MQLSEPLAIAIIRARDRALDALDNLRRAVPDGADAKCDAIEIILCYMGIDQICERLAAFPICIEADRVVAEMVTDEKAVNGDASPNQPLP